MSAENTLKGSLSNIFALTENYPQLSASENMARLQVELSSTENKIAFARQAYNNQTLLYNTAQQTLPAALLTSMFGHHLAEMYPIEVKKAVKVAF